MGNKWRFDGKLKSTNSMTPTGGGGGRIPRFLSMKSKTKQENVQELVNLGFSGFIAVHRSKHATKKTTKPCPLPPPPLPPLHKNIARTRNYDSGPIFMFCLTHQSNDCLHSVLDQSGRRKQPREAVPIQEVTADGAPPTDVDGSREARGPRFGAAAPPSRQGDCNICLLSRLQGRLQCETFR